MDSILTVGDVRHVGNEDLTPEEEAQIPDIQAYLKTVAAKESQRITDATEREDDIRKIETMFHTGGYMFNSKVMFAYWMRLTREYNALTIYTHKRKTNEREREITGQKDYRSKAWKDSRKKVKCPMGNSLTKNLKP